MRRTLQCALLGAAVLLAGFRLERGLGSAAGEKGDPGGAVDVRGATSLARVPTRLTVRQLGDYLRRAGIPHARLDLASLTDRINEAAERNALDPGLLLAVIRVESTFRPEAISDRGAVGLMQLRPTTAAEVARDMGVPWGGDHTLLEPDLNIDLGAHYLRTLLDRFQGDEEAALQAYYQGPNGLDAAADPATFDYARLVIPRIPVLR
jgi:soluble lytic murein transglycosylase-like protein